MRRRHGRHTAATPDAERSSILEETGHQLQFIESEIMMGVLRKCRGAQIVALPIFDCVVVKSSAEKTVKEIMKREFKAATGLNIEVKRE